MQKEHLLGQIEHFSKDKMHKTVAISLCGFSKTTLLEENNNICEICRMMHNEMIDRDMGNSELIAYLKKHYLTGFGSNSDLYRSIIEREILANSRIRGFSQENDDLRKKNKDLEEQIVNLSKPWWKKTKWLWFLHGK